MIIKIIGRMIGLGACIASLWILYKITAQGYITLVESNVYILAAELILMMLGIIILVFDIYPEIIKEIKKCRKQT